MSNFVEIDDGIHIKIFLQSQQKKNIVVIGNYITQRLSELPVLNMHLTNKHVSVNPVKNYRCDIKRKNTPFFERNFIICIFQIQQWKETHLWQSVIQKLKITAEKNMDWNFK